MFEISEVLSGQPKVYLKVLNVEGVGSALQMFLGNFFAMSNVMTNLLLFLDFMGLR